MTKKPIHPEEPTLEVPRAIIPDVIHLADDMADIAGRLRILRNRAGLTLEALSLVTKGVDPEGKGISRVSLSRYEAGAEPGLREVKLLSWAYRKPLSFIVYGTAEDIVAGNAHEPLELMLENMIAETVISVLENRGVIPPKRGEDRESYERLIEEAKQRAK
jgi:transcriptional regulator with XRE-family HTH domain